jgi:two-component system, NarL family, response regulator LiaR
MDPGGICVVVVDDHALYRRGLRRLLTEAGIDVVGEAADGRAGVRAVAEHRPDVTLMDMNMPLLSGADAIAEIVSRDPDARVLVLSGTGEEHAMRDALLAGAQGFLLKTAPTRDIVAGIRAVHEGRSLISPQVAAGLVFRLRERATEPPAPVVQLPPPDLTTRELDVLRLVAAGKENSAIAGELFLSPKTVKNHVATILDKLAIDNRVQAAVFAVRHGLAD